MKNFVERNSIKFENFSLITMNLVQILI